MNRMALVGALSLVAAACTFEDGKEIVADLGTESLELGKADGPNDQGAIQFDERVTRRLLKGARYHLYTLQVADRSDAFVDLASRQGGDMFLALYRQSGSGLTFIAQNDDCWSGTLHSCLEVDLSAGTYLVLVTTYQYAALGRPTAVDYELEVLCRGGACADPPACDSPGGPPCAGGAGTTCGGIAALACNDGLRCDYSGNDSCLIADMSGVCVSDEPIACLQVYDPVCGCDGETYGNDCHRRAAGVALAHPGICAGGVGATCGGIASLECGAGLRCDYSANVGCDIADVAGVCASEEPVFCTNEYEPVCGCDGVTYGNECYRRAAGVALAAAGACPT